VQLYRYFVSQSSEFCRHNPLCRFSTSVYYCCLFCYRLSPETFGYTNAEFIWLKKSNLSKHISQVCMTLQIHHLHLKFGWNGDMKCLIKKSVPGAAVSVLRSKITYEGVSKSFWTGRLERELNMVQLSATRCSCIAILWVSLVSFAALIILCCFSTSVCCCGLFRFRLSPETFG
jgi:hypothetical protein